MNFFRSEGHLRNCDGFDEKKKGGIIALNDLMHLFSGPFFTQRRDLNYYSDMKKYTLDFIETSQSIVNAGSYWRLKWFEKIGFSIAMRLRLI